MFSGIFACIHHPHIRINVKCSSMLCWWQLQFYDIQGIGDASSMTKNDGPISISPSWIIKSQENPIFSTKWKVFSAIVIIAIWEIPWSCCTFQSYKATSITVASRAQEQWQKWDQEWTSHFHWIRKSQSSEMNHLRLNIHSFDWQKHMICLHIQNLLN